MLLFFLHIIRSFCHSVDREMCHSPYGDEVFEFQDKRAWPSPVSVVRVGHLLGIPATAICLLAPTAKRDEIARLMGILELDLEEKNVLPPREAYLHARLLEHTYLICHA